MAALSLFALVTIAVAASGFSAAATPHAYENTDQANIGAMILRLSDPTVLARDYVFRDTRLFRFYTPGYLALIGSLMRWTGSFDYALAALAPIVLFVYLTGSFLLLYQVTRRSLASAIISVVSAFPKLSIAATFWGVAGADIVMPRTLFTMLVPWLLLGWFRWCEDESWWKLPLVSLCVGLGANLHPVSGFVMLQVLLVLLCFGERPSVATLGRVALCAAAAVVGVWPTLSNFVRGSALVPETGDAGAVPFHLVYAVLHDRLGTLFPIHPSFLTLGPFSLGRTQQIGAVALYVGVMVPLAVAWVRTLAESASRPSPRVLFTLLLLVQLPLATLLTRFGQPGLVGLVALYPLLLRDRAPDDWDWRFLGWMIAVISLGYVALPLLDFLWLRLEWRSLTSLVGEQLRISRFIYLPLFVFAARVLAELERRLAPGWKRTALVLSLGLVVLGLDAPAALRAACAPPASARERDAFALYDWARTETDRDSLFYFDSADFRFRAERSITHGWKDVGLAYYAGDVAVRFHARYFAFQRGYRDPRKLRRIAAAHDVDYVVVDKQRHGDLSPDLPVAFANDSFVVYRF